MDALIEKARQDYEKGIKEAKKLKEKCKSLPSLPLPTIDDLKDMPEHVVEEIEKQLASLSK